MSSAANPKPLDPETLAKMQASVIAQIERDFATVNRVGGVSIREAGVIDDWGTDEECARARAQDTDTHWSEVDIHNLDPGGAALTFCDPVGFRYLMPAYMVFTLRHGEYGDAESIDSDCHDSARSAAEFMDPLGGPTVHTCEQFSLFSDAQRRCVARFLVCEIERDAMDMPELADRALGALKRYWMQFLDAGEADQLRKRWPQLRD